MTSRPRTGLKETLKEWVQRTRKLHPGKKVWLWFRDEGRFGLQGAISRVWALKGKRAYASKQTDFEWVYVFGVVCPATGQTHSCLISFADTSAMNGYLKDFSKQFPSDAHVLMVLDRAGWHRSKALRIAENLTLLLSPAYSPELNLVELVWWQIRDKHLGNQVFETAEQLDREVVNAWCDVTCDPETIRSLRLLPWIGSAINN